MDAQLEELFRGVGTLLSRYKSGKLPKAFKIIPSLQNWQQVNSKPAVNVSMTAKHGLPDNAGLHCLGALYACNSTTWEQREVG